MKRDLLSTLLAALLSILLVSCGTGEEEQGGYRLYFTRQVDASHGAALDTETWPGEEEGDQLAYAILTDLLKGPASEELTSPFPVGVSVEEVGWEAEEPGVLTVVLSEQYAGLTDMSQTLADACIVLTLSQLPGVEQVEIRAEGTFGARGPRRLSAGQLDLNSLLA